MDLLYTIKNLLSGNRGLEASIEKNLQKSSNTPDEIDEYLRFLRKDLESAIEHQAKGQYLLIHILRELRTLEWQVQQIQTGQSFPVIGLDYSIELNAIRDIKEILVSYYQDLVELVERMNKRIVMLQETLQIHTKRTSPTACISNR